MRSIQLFAVAGLLSLGVARANAQALVYSPAESNTPPDATNTQVTELLSAPPSSSAPEPALPEAGPADTTSSNVSNELPPAGHQPAEISANARRFHFGLTLDAAIAYNDNIDLTQTDKVSGTFATLQATITLGVGDIESHEGNYLRLDYTPTAFFYLDHSDFDTVNHIFRLEGYHRFRRLAVTIAQDIESTDNNTVPSLTGSGGFTRGANIDVATRQRVTLFNTRANASYDLTGKTSVTVGALFSATDYTENLINSQIISGTLGLDYHYSDKLTFGLDGTVGEDLVDDPSPDQTFEQVRLHSRYDLTGKISASGSAGVEFRQFEHGDGDNVTPVFDVGLTYAPFDGTTINISASRQTISSATLANQDYSSTQLVMAFRQRLFRRFTAELSGGYQNLSYFSTINGDSTAREDNYYFVQPAVDVRITNFWFAGAYYLHRENDSSFDALGFEENQFGVHTGFKF